MELKIKDSYRAECIDYLSSSMLRSLYLFYQPIISVDALALYMTLYTDAFLQKTSDSHQRLSTLLNLSIESIEKARIHLEEFNLLDTYVQETDQKNRYIYSLKAPLDEEGFLASKEMLSIYLNAVGKKQLELNLGRMGSYKISTNDYRKITRIVNHTSNTNTYVGSKYIG